MAHSTEEDSPNELGLAPGEMSRRDLARVLSGVFAPFLLAPHLTAAGAQHTAPLFSAGLHRLADPDGHRRVSPLHSTAREAFEDESTSNAGSAGVLNALQGGYVVTDPPYSLRGDGMTDNRVGFQRVLAAVSSRSGRIIFPPGSYLMSGVGESDYITIAGASFDGLTIEGEPGAEWIITSATVRYALLLQSIRRLIIKGITFRYQQQPRSRSNAGSKCVRVTGCADAIFEDCEITGSPQYGLAFERCTRPTVRSCRVHDTMADGINFNSCSAPAAVLNDVWQTGDDGIALSTPQYAAVGERAEGAILALNRVRSTNSRGLLALGENITIASNTVAETSAASIAVVRDLAAADPGMRSKTVAITGNICSSANTAGQSAGPNGSPRVRHGADGAGAILVASTDGRSYFTDAVHENILVQSNAIDGSARAAIFIQGSRGVTVLGNAINNPCGSVDATTDAAISIIQAHAVTVHDNTLVNDTAAAASVHVEACSMLSVGQNPASRPVVIVRSSPACWVSHDGAVRSINGVLEQWGVGHPEGVVIAPVGSVYHRVDNAEAFYVKRTGTGSEGWQSL